MFLVTDHTLPVEVIHWPFPTLMFSLPKSYLYIQKGYHQVASSQKVSITVKGVDSRLRCEQQPAYLKCFMKLAVAWKHQKKHKKLQLILWWWTAECQCHFPLLSLYRRLTLPGNLKWLSILFMEAGLRTHNFYFVGVFSAIITNISALAVFMQHMKGCSVVAWCNCSILCVTMPANVRLLVWLCKSIIDCGDAICASSILVEF